MGWRKHLVSVALAVSACGTSGTGGGGTGGAGGGAGGGRAMDSGAADSGATDAGLPSAQFQRLYDSIVAMRCGGNGLGGGLNCHLTTVDPGGGLAMPDAPTALRNLVNVASRNPCWSALRVAPYDAGQSALYEVHRRDCSTPRHSVLLGNPALDAGELGVVEAWINSGAR